MKKEVQIDDSWKYKLEEFFNTDTFSKLSFFIKSEYKNKKVYPDPKDIFNAFNLTPFDKVKVVILGQDPYHGEGQAHGLSFSVKDGVKLPPSLKNIYKEIETDLEIKKDFSNGNLESWAKQGVLLLNAVMTVVSGTPSSHKDKGWEEFTDFVIKKISDGREGVVFMLWGNFAKSKKNLIDENKHLILESVHPSPFSAHDGFFGCKHFSLCNKYLRENKKEEIKW